jgi:hypothetical protein
LAHPGAWRPVLDSHPPQGPLADVLDTTQLVYDVSGAGNNWAHGHHGYGPTYREALSEQLRRAAEACESLQSFLLLHSLGGGTGSGLGTYILGMLQVSVAERRALDCRQAGNFQASSTSRQMDVPASAQTTEPSATKWRERPSPSGPSRTDPFPAPPQPPRIPASNLPHPPLNRPSSHPPALWCQDEYPGVFRFSAPVFPSEDDHVVTAPYNALLAASRLVADADCVLPVENQALLDITSRLDRGAGGARGAAGAAAGDTASGGAGEAGGGAAGGGGGGASGNKPWDAMNGVAANMLLHLTAGMRFEGSLNVDLNDITSNLVPFPRMHFLLSSLAPLAAPRDVGRLAAPRSMDQVGGGGGGGGGGGVPSSGEAPGMGRGVPGEVSPARRPPHRQNCSGQGPPRGQGKRAPWLRLPLSTPPLRRLLPPLAVHGRLQPRPPADLGGAAAAHVPCDRAANARRGGRRRRAAQHRTAAQRAAAGALERRGEGRLRQMAILIRPKAQA